MFNPVSTYRIQFHKGFTFSDLESILPYLQKLGIGSIYASPIFEAVPGSQHGYDVVNPNRINPELGTEAQLREISRKLKEHGIGWVQDIVPNHMAFHPRNLWLMDVLEKGRYSIYASFFDLGWTSDLFHGRLIVPFLGSSLDDVIANGDLTIEHEAQRLVLRYFDTHYPIHSRSYASILGSDDAPDAIRQLTQQIDELHTIDEPVTYNLRWHELMLQLDALVQFDGVHDHIRERIRKVNEDKELLRKITGEQNYQLAPWQKSDTAINFRRFFTINQLIGLNMQEQKVFDHYHTLIKQLVDDQVFQGLRIDHIDGLYDPTKYLSQLRKLAGPDTYITVEKILQHGEELPAWPVQGTTGYDFLAQVNQVIADTQAAGIFSEFYSGLLNDQQPLEEKIREKKKDILTKHMNGELDNLCRLFSESALGIKETRNAVTPETLKAVIGAVLIFCPVYRCYGNSMPLDETEATWFQDVLHEIRKYHPELDEGLALLREALIDIPQIDDADYRGRALRFYMRCMQFTGPLMAKGFEDTLLYTYNRFIGHNEVGDSPVVFGITPDAFHDNMRSRQANWPLALSATATHDTKRGEDVRTRLAVLTELPSEWLSLLHTWMDQVEKTAPGIPDTNDEYFVYQILAGVFPFLPDEEADLKERLEEYMTKALREGKRNTTWATPNEDYEKGVIQFTGKLLQRGQPFRKQFKDFLGQITDGAVINSLAQVLLKLTCPGVPDIYQGCELYDLSLVDPDNRRPVDYNIRAQWLDEVSNQRNTTHLIHELWEERKSGKLKLWLLHVLLKARKQAHELFAEGSYIPMETDGAYKDHVLAYARKLGKEWCIVLVPLRLTALCRQQRKSPATLNWKDTRVILPPGAPTNWEDLLACNRGKASADILIRDVFKDIPLGLLQLKKSESNRSAGILLHITSLPSPFGVGDLGPQAYTFADFLQRSHQAYWQLLPLNPIEAGSHYSPYSSFSAMAGNTLLISPELLVRDQLLTEDDLKPYHLPVHDLADFAEAKRVKDTLLDTAWKKFRAGEETALHKEFYDFNQKEAYWLDEFALYVTLKAHHQGEPWYRWEARYKKRHPQSLQQFTDENAEAVLRVKWMQFIFDRQWNALKHYCNDKGIELFGDLPFYLCHDSVDVWANPEIFNLDDKGDILGMAGVPPDFFNDDGQLWGMPVFNWDVLKSKDYSWWVQRLRRNRELFDLIRIDHFRAFADYWEVPAGSATAAQGNWRIGPGMSFFTAIRQQLGDLPFIAEDLGEVTNEVYLLRDELNLPGMKVLQFAFSGEPGESVFSPHNFASTNFVVYTGTHDNNTTRGWFRKELDKEKRKGLELYTGTKVREGNVHLALTRMAYSSTAKVAIIPMQDILALDEKSRLNLPGSSGSNWLWRMSKGMLTPETEVWLRDLTQQYGRR
jgi:malto-oligosyltrehalose synthase/4-alpha-glucanotransferase